LAIEYLAGERIRGTAAERTGLSNLAAGGWTQASTDDIVIENSVIKYKDHSYNLEKIYYDLGSALSDTQWTMRFKGTFTGTAAVDEPLFAFEITDTANVAANATCDALGLHWYIDRANTWRRIYGVNKNGQSGVRGTDSVPQEWGDFVSGTPYWIQVERTSSTAGTVKIYSDEFSTLVTDGTLSNTIPAGLTGLRYLHAQHYNQGSGYTGEIDDVRIWNSTNNTSGTPTYSFTFSDIYPDLSNGTIFEDSSDGKHYMWDGTDTWNEMS
jgi:hypothetical protein